VVSENGKAKKKLTGYIKPKKGPKKEETCRCKGRYKGRVERGTWKLV